MKARRAGSPGQSFPKLTARISETELGMSCFRLEKIFASDKPAGTKTNPTANFWATYKKVADEYDNDMISKYVGDLDTSLLFVSTSTSPVFHARLNLVFSSC